MPTVIAAIARKPNTLMAACEARSRSPGRSRPPAAAVRVTLASFRPGAQPSRPPRPASRPARASVQSRGTAATSVLLIATEDRVGDAQQVHTDVRGSHFQIGAAPDCLLTLPVAKYLAERVPGALRDDLGAGLLGRLIRRLAVL